MNETFALIRSFTLVVVSMVATCSVWKYICARRPVCVEFLIQEIIELTHVRYCYCEAKVRSSSVSV